MSAAEGQLREVAACIHVRVTVTHAPPGGRWVCEACGTPFQPLDLTPRLPHSTALLAATAPTPDEPTSRAGGANTRCDRCTAEEVGLGSSALCICGPNVPCWRCGQGVPTPDEPVQVGFVPDNSLDRMLNSFEDGCS